MKADLFPGCARTVSQYNRFPTPARRVRRVEARRWLAAAAAVAVAPFTALAGSAVFDGSNATAGNPGDNATWTDANNWSLNSAFDTAPSSTAPGDDLTFGNNGTVGATINLLGSQFANSLTFQNANYTLGTSNATTDILTNTTGNVVVNTGITATINAVLAGANGLSLSGGGTLILGRTNNTFTGNILVDGSVAGTALQITGQGNADPLSLGAGTNKTITLTNNGIFRVASTNADPSNNTKIFIIGSGGGTFDIGSSTSLTLNDGTNITNLAASNGAQLQGAGNLTKTGAGTLILGQANGTSFNGGNFTGNLIINAGTVQAFGTAAGSTPLGTTAGNTQIFNSGVLDLQANTSEAIVINGTNATGSLITGSGSGVAGGVTINTPIAYIGGNGTLVPGVISDSTGNSGLVKVGTGALVLNSAPTYGGTTTISAGAIRVTNAANLPAQNIVLAGGAIETSFNPNPTLGTGAGQFNLPGGAGGFSSFNPGTTASTVTVTVNGGSQLQFGTTNFNPSALILNQTTANAPIVLTNDLDLNGGNRTITVGNAIGTNTATVSGLISNSSGTAVAGLTKNGNGVLILTNTGNSYNGTTTINGGVLRGTEGVTLPINNLIINGGSFETGTNFTRAIGTGANQVQFGTNAAGFSAFGGPVVVDLGGDGTGTGGQLVWGSATFNPSALTLNEASANNTIAFRNSINLQTGTTLATRTINVNAGTATLSGFITQSSGTAALTKNGSGMLVISNPTNNFTGTFTFGAGVVNVASLGDYGVPSSVGARLASQETASGGDIVGLHFTGGTLQYTGSTPQSTNRQMRVGTNGATFDASGANTNATLSFTYSAANLNLFDTAGSRTFTFTGSNTGTNTFALALTDQAATNKTSLTKSGLGRWILTNPNSSFSGNVSIVSGNLRITNSGALGNGTVARTVSIIPTVNPTSFPGLELDGSAGNITLSSNISFTTSYDALNGSAPYPNQGAVINLAGNNTINGNFSLTSGGGGTAFLVNRNSSLTLGGNLTPIQTSRALYTRGDGNLIINGVIANGSTTTGLPFTHQAGTGVVTMNAANTYTGSTLISSGALLVNGTNGVAALAQASYTVNAADGFGGGLLGGTGTINLANNQSIFLTGTPSLTGSNNGTLSPGNGLAGQGAAGIGTLTIAGTGTATVNFGSNSTFAVDLGTGNASDKLTLSGSTANLTIAGNTTTPASNFSDTLALTTANTGTFTVASWGGTRSGVFDFVTLNGQNDPGTFAVNGSVTTFTAADNSVLVNYDDTNKNIVVTVNAVPEPTTGLFLLPVALATLGRRKRRNAATRPQA